MLDDIFRRGMLFSAAKATQRLKLVDNFSQLDRRTWLRVKSFAILPVNFERSSGTVTALAACVHCIRSGPKKAEPKQSGKQFE